MPTIPPISGRTDRFVRFVRRRSRAVLLVAAVLTALSGWLAAGLELRTDFAELLPTADPAVVELRRVQDRIQGTAALIVAIQSPDRQANLRLAGDVAARLEALPRETVSLVAWNLRAERDFFSARRWLYASEADLGRLRDLFRQRIEKAKNPLIADLDGEGESLDDIRARYEKRAEQFGIDRLPDGYFTNPEGTFAAVVAIPPKGLFAENAGVRLRNETLRILRELGPSRYHPAMKTGLSGDVMTQLEERDALERDLVWASSICTALVVVSILLFYGRLSALPFLGIPVLVGTAATFAIARLAFGYLNSSTAFLGSIIVGNGVNFGIIQLARYEEERRAGVVREVALVRSFAATLRATGIASLAAAIAYGSLIVTRFRGFSQFGVIGGLGMVLCWAATMTLLPALLWTFDRRPRPPMKPLKHPIIDPAARLVSRHPRAVLAAGAALTLGALLVLPGYVRDPFEYNFRNLRNERADTEGEGAWSPQLNALFGRALNPTLILADSPEHAVAVQRAVLARDGRAPGGPILSRVLTVFDLLPGDAAAQRRKVSILDEMRGLAADPAMKLLDDAERAELERYLPPAGLAPVSLEDLPRLARWPFTESDGTTGRLVLIFPADAPRYEPWNGRHLIELADRVREVHTEDGQVARATGGPVVFAGMIQSILRDGPIATLVSAGGVAMLVLLLARRSGAALVSLGTLLAGVVWMLGAAALTGQRVNFLNFVALPLTLGIGVDYAINICLRYQLEGPGRLVAALRATGGAVALCSLTTIIGYGALLVADSLALRSFGRLAILGEVACLAAGAVLLPALLLLREPGARAEPQRKGRRTA